MVESGTGSDHSWNVVWEFGLEYFQPGVPAASAALTSPIAAERLDAGVHLIVDDTLAPAIARRPPNVLARSRRRTLLVSAGQDPIYDSRALGIEDAYGCRIEENRIAVLDCERRKLAVLRLSGEVLQSLDLSGITQSAPRIVSWTWRESFLVVFGSEIARPEIVEVDLDGRVVTRFQARDAALGVPASTQLLAGGSVLIADQFQHVVCELNSDGLTSIRWGKWHRPSALPGHLSSPRWARQLDDGALLIADTNNHRTLLVDNAGTAAEIRAPDVTLVAPAAVSRLSNGNYLVCDAGNHCVLELNAKQGVLWQAGTPRIRRRSLSFPRSIQYLGERRYLVADTAHDRVVEVGEESITPSAVSERGVLFWPRAARTTPSGSILIADGRNSRVLELSPSGRVLRQIAVVRYKGRSIELRDPHDVRLLPNDKLLIADAGRYLVIETDWEGEAARVIGLDDGVALADPHSAQLLADGRLLIADSGNHRILFIDLRSGACESVQDLSDGVETYRLDFPKYAECTADGTLVIADSGNHRVLVADGGRVVRSVLARISGSPLASLGSPRWAQWLGKDEILVSDHANHRVLHLRSAGKR